MPSRALSFIFMSALGIATGAAGESAGDALVGFWGGEGRLSLPGANTLMMSSPACAYIRATLTHSVGRMTTVPVKCIMPARRLAVTLAAGLFSSIRSLPQFSFLSKPSVSGFSFLAFHPLSAI